MKRAYKFKRLLIGLIATIYLFSLFVPYAQAEEGTTEAPIVNVDEPNTQQEQQEQPNQDATEQKSEAPDAGGDTSPLTESPEAQETITDEPVVSEEAPIQEGSSPPEGTKEEATEQSGEQTAEQNAEQPIKEETTEPLEQPEQSLQPLKPTIKGQLMIGDKPVVGEWVNIHSKTDEWFNDQTDSTGNFSFNLPDGEYEIQGIWLENEQKWYQLDKTFKVVNGNLEDTNELSINLAPKPLVHPVTGTVKRAGVPVVGDTVNIVSSAGEWFNAVLNENGEFEFSLPEGQYELQGIWVSEHEEWNQLNKKFKVTDGGLVLNIDVKETVNIEGSVKRSSEPVAGDWVNALSSTGQWYNAQLNSDGQFTLALPDGEYEIQGIWVSKYEEWNQINKKFTVVSGKLEGTLAIELKPPVIENNVMGSIKRDGEPINGDWVNVLATDGKWYNAQLDQNGTFGLSLPDGSYEIQGIWVSKYEEWNQLNKKFSVSNGVLKGNLDIDVKQTGNIVTGIFKLANVNDWINVKSSNNKWYNTQLDANGNFQITLPDGEYEIQGVWSSKYQEWIQLNFTFKVSGNEDLGELKLPPPPPPENVHGSVKRAGTPVTGDWVNVLSSTGDWFNAQLDDNGNFSLNLADGEYEIQGIWVSSPGQWYVLNKKFIVANGQLEGTLDFDVEEVVKNVRGTFTYANEPIIGDWVSVLSSDGVWYNAQLDNNGNFELRLPDGEYEISGIWVTSTQEWLELNETFKVVGGEQDKPLKIDVKTSNVKGHVKDGSNAVLTTVSFHTTGSETRWYTAQTDESGNFELFLPDDEYLVDGIWVDDKQQWYPINLKFSVEDSKLKDLEEISINIGAETVDITGTLYDINQPVGEADIQILNVETNQISSGKTDAQGNFTVKLLNGKYKVVAASNPKIGTIQLNEQFEIVNKQLIINGETKDKLTIFLPAVTAKGSIVNASVPVHGANVYVKRIVNGEVYSFVTEEDGSFELRVPNGDYQILYVSLTNGAYYGVGSLITIPSGEDIKVDLAEIITDVSVSGTVTYKGQNVTNGKIHVSTQDGHRTYIREFKDGTFLFSLPVGTYYISAVETNEYGSSFVNIPFTLNKATPVTGLQVVLADTNIEGIVSSGGKPIVNASVQISKLGEDYDSMDAVTNNEGKFKLQLSDGEYRVDGVEGEGYTPVGLDFEVIDGTLIVNGQETMNLSIEVPPLNVNGKIVKGDIGIMHASVLFHYDSMNGEMFELETDDKGEFKGRFKDGKYNIDEIVTYENRSHQYSFINYSFEVVNGKIYVKGIQQDKLIIEIPSDENEFVTRIFGDTTGIDGLSISIMELNGDKDYSAYVDLNDARSTTIRLPDGNYTIDEVWDATHDVSIGVNILVTVKEGVLTVNGVQQDSLDIYLPEVSLTGSILDGTIPVPNSTVTISNGQQRDMFLRSDISGNFSARLVDGHYTVTGVDLRESPDFIAMNKEFEIRNGKLFIENVETQTLDLRIPAESLKGKLLDGDKGVANSRLTIRNINRNQTFSLHTNESGEFGSRLPDGSYLVERAYLEDEFASVNLSVEFTIENGKLYVSGTAKDRLVINLPAITLKGIVSDSNGSVENFTLSIRKQDSTNSVSVKTNYQGEFFGRLADGNYKIESGYSPTSWSPLDIAFSIVNGKLQIDGEESESLRVIIQSITLKGIVMADDLPAKNVSLTIERIDKGQYFTISSNESGQFYGRLEDGKYQLTQVNTQDNQRTKMDLSFEIKEGKIYVNEEEKEQLQVNLPSVTLKGIVLDEGKTVTSADLGIEQINNYQYFNARTNQDGAFHVRLPDGQYRITGVYMENSWNQLDIPFEIKDGKLIVGGQEKDQLTVNLSPKTLHGLLLDGDKPVTNATLFARNMANYQEVSLNTDNNGQFSGRLKDGSYQINTIILNHTQWVELGLIEFSIKDGLLYVSQEKKEKLILQLPSVTLKGKVLDGSNVVPNVNVELRNEDTYNHFNVQTNETGEFVGRLKDGNYSVARIYTQYSGWVDIKLTFSISGGKLLINGVEEDSLIVNLPKSTLTGKVFDGTVPALDVDFQIQHQNGNITYIRTKSDGSFTAYLSDGEYKIGYISLLNNVIANSNIVFSIIDGKLVINGKESEQLRVELSPMTLKGSVVDGDSSVVHGGIEIASQGNQSFYVPIGSTGTFSARLVDGAYNVTRVYTSKGDNLSITKPFEIKDGKLYVSDTETDSLTVNISTSILKGQIFDGKVKVPQAELNIQHLETGLDTYIVADENGDFQKKFSDGDYKVTSIYHQEIGWYKIDLFFSIENGVLLVNGEARDSLEIKIPGVKVNGFVWDGSNKVPDANIQIQNDKDTSKFGVWSDHNGQFSIRLNDGEYTVTNLGKNELGYFELSSKFVIQDGKLFVNGEQKDGLDLTFPKVTLTGTVYDGTETVPNAYLYVERENSQLSQYITTDENGDFANRLTDGVYKIVNIGSPNHQYYEMYFEFEINDGQLYVSGEKQEKLNLKIPANAFKGKLLEGDTVLSYANLEIQSLKYNSLTFVTTEQNGEFSSRLPDGEYNLSTVSNTWVGSVKMNLSFSVQDGLLFVNGQQTEYWNLQLAEYENTGQVQDGFGLVPNIEFIIYTNDDSYVRSVKSNKEGKFTYKLEDGTYQINSVRENDTNYSIDVEFEIANNKLFVNGKESETLIIPLINNVTVGKVYDANGPISNAHVGIIHQDVWYTVVTDEQGVYKVRATDGEFTVFSVEKDGYKALDESFTIVNGQIVGNMIDIQMIEPNLTGYVKNEQGEILTGRVHITNESGYTMGLAYTDPNGYFQYRLEDGEYRIWDIISNDSWYQYIIDLRFSIVNGKNFVNGQQVDNLNLTANMVKY
ncbi:hypothetical protein [Bacillus sp. V5-8f]|uniref:hypothetical protein n=1 Tax=Bacillus sp. V5-8f TaxID=2053044 RepID=UPI000C785525|nr:hypothetical protein [Bacillus sp. V5-8f]PLT35744.1 hypothetical protein CUU64_00230 [Bacillus sp. V5-8f]